MEVGDQGRGILDSLLPQRLQPLAADVRIRSCCNDHKDDEYDTETRLAEARPAPRPVDEPDECECRRCCEDGAGRADGYNLELGTGTLTVGEAGKRGCPEAGLLAQKLRGDDEIAEVLEESLVVGASET